MGRSHPQKDPSAASTPVLIVGGSLVGLSAAAFLASRGVPVVLVEKHLGSSLRAIGCTTRTLELFRAVGIEVPESAHGAGPPRRARVESLTGRWFEGYPSTPPAGGAKQALEYSPAHPTAIAQERLEPILRDRARDLGADLRPGVQPSSFTENGSGVTATLRSRDDGGEQQIRARYLVAADGASSEIREALGIGRTGGGPAVSAAQHPVSCPAG